MEAELHATEGVRWRDGVDPGVEDRLAAAVDELALLPVIDVTVERIGSAVDDPASTTADLATILERDPAFADRLLRLVNAPGRTQPIRARTVRQAVMAVGRGHLHRLALETATDRFLEQALGGASLRAAAECAGAAAIAIAERVGIAPGVPHLAALLHDAGTLVLPLAFDPAARAPAAIADSGPPVARAATGDPRDERARVGVDHAVAGAMLAERWNLPEGVPEAIALHHGGASGDGSPTAEIAVVQIAAQVPRIVAGRQPDDRLLRAALDRCGAGWTLLQELTGGGPRRRRQAQASGSSSPRSATSVASSVL